MNSFREIFEKATVTFSKGETGEKEVYLMTDNGSVVIKPTTTKEYAIEDLEKMGVKIDKSIEKLVDKALKAIKKK